MDKLQPVNQIENKKGLRQKIKKGKQKFEQLIVRHKDDFITALEKNWRDWFFRPLTNLFRLIGISANQITYSGFFLIAAAIWAYFERFDFKWQLLILLLAGLTDAIDGPLARNNNNVTALGTWLDHIRDYSLIAWITYILYMAGTISPQFIAIMWILQIILIWIILKDFLKQYLRGLPDGQEPRFIKNFSLDNMQTTIIGRLQFFFWFSAYMFLLLHIIHPSQTFVIVGQGLILLEIIFAALNISECYQKSAPK